MDATLHTSTLSRLPDSFRFHHAIELGVHRKSLARLVASGEIERLGRGVYRKAAVLGDGGDDLVVVAQRVPEAVFCLDSALYFHELGTRLPHQVMFAVDRKAWLPVIDQPPVRAFRFSGKAFSEGIELHDAHGVSLRVYGKAKTVADCFKYRNKLGLETALDALRSLVRQPGFVVDDLLRFCKICRVEKVVVPYLEALL
jgi:predicted transcriptional regulator of viral defense system